MVELQRDQTTDTPNCEYSKTPRYNLLYGDVRVRPSKKTVGEVSPNVQRSLLFRFKVSAEVSKVKYNPAVSKTRITQDTQQRVYDPTPAFQ